VIISGKDGEPERKVKSFKKREIVAKEDDQPVAPPKEKARDIVSAQTATAPVVAAPVSPPAAPQSGVFVNGRQLSIQELQQHQAIYNAPVQPGRYWYDPTSGLYGYWGHEAIGYIRTGHGYGPAPANASNGNTGIFLNGRQINAAELVQWQALFRQAIQPGRYWLDGNTGNVGVEGNPQPTGNVRAAIQASRGYR